MTNMTWTLNAEGRLTVTWITPPVTRAAATPGRLSRAAALAAYYRLQTSLARHSAA